MENGTGTADEIAQAVLKQKVKPSAYVIPSPAPAELTLLHLYSMALQQVFIILLLRMAQVISKQERLQSTPHQ